VSGAKGDSAPRDEEARGECSPPSAAGHLEPYGARVSLRPQARPLEAGSFVKAMLESVASACVTEGATLIGHLKCVLRTDGGPVFGNLTSVSVGAVVRGGDRTEAVPVLVAPGVEAHLDLAVLVYGLSAEAIDGLVGAALEHLLTPLDALWDKDASFSSPHRA
jgi:hypothetical protein